MSSELTCEVCGSVIEVGEEKLPVRDKDWLPCPVCRSELASWNGSTTYFVERVIRRGDDPPARDSDRATG